MEKNLSSESISTYLSGIRQAHLTKGEVPGCLRPDITNTLLKGYSNLAKVTETKKERLRVTIVTCWALARSFRIHEILAREQESYDSTSILIASVFRLTSIPIEGKKTELLMVKIKNPKDSDSGDDWQQL